MNREHPFIERNRVTDCSDDGILVDYNIHELTVRDNFIQGCGGNGIRFPSSSWLEGNTVEDCGLDGISGYRGTLRNNQVRRVGGTGIEVYGVEGEFAGNSVVDAHGVGISAGAAIFTSNVVGRCGSHGIESMGGSFENNTIYRCGGSGIRMSSGVLLNNVAYQNERYAIEIAGGGQFFCNDWNENLLGAVQGDTVGATDIDVDPRFCDVDHDSIGLRPDSPLLAAGDCGLIGARGLGCDAPTEILVALFTAESMDQGVRLRWRLGGDELPSSAWIERSDSEPGPWQRIATERVLEPDARVDWDRGAQPSHRYWYRLAWTRPDREAGHSSPIEVVTGSNPSAFTLRALGPNPTNGPITMEYSLPRSASIELTIHDLMGREVARLASGVQPSGLHATRWTGEVQGGGQAGPGIYFVRLRHPDGQESRRILLRR